MPSERALAEELEISHLTVRRGLDALVDEGVIIKRPRVGNFVRKTPDRNQVRHIVLAIPHYYLHDEFRHPLVATLLDGVMRALDQQQYNVVPMSFRRDHFWNDLGQLLIDRQVDGVLLETGPDERDVRRLLDAGIKVVLASRDTHLEGVVPRVGVQSAGVYAEGMRKLIELGHRRIQVLRYSYAPATLLADEAIREVASTYDLGDIDQFRMIIPNADGEVDYTVLTRVFDRMPTAVIVPDECIASELFRLCYQRGINIPKDISLVAIANHLAQANPIALSAPDTRLLFRQVAQYGAELLVKMIDKEADANCDLDLGLHAKIKWTDSVAPLSHD